MKKLFALLLTLLMLTSVPAFAAGYDTEWLADYPEVFDFALDEDESDIAYIDCTPLFDSASLSFEHKYESDEYYSNIFNDLIVLDYGADGAYPVWRTWIYLYGKQGNRVSAVTIAFNGKSYRFDGILKEEYIDTLENGDILQTMCIKYCTANRAFMEDMTAYYEQMVEGEESPYNAVDTKADVTMTMHGTEDITVQLPPAFVMDFYLIHDAFTTSDQTDAYLAKVETGTKLTVTDAK